MAEIIISGINEFDDGMKRNILRMDTAARNIVQKGGLVIERKAKEGFIPRPSGSKRVVKNGPNKGRIYYAGAPKYPANPPKPTQRTGNLRNSTRFQGIKQMGIGRWMSQTGPTVQYAPFVEYGTSHAREFPYMRTAVKDSNEEINRIAQEEWRLAQE